jgi:hypothetical protein
MVAMSWGFNMFNYSWNKRELFDAVKLPGRSSLPL